MKIIESRALRGPNYFAQRPLIFMKVDLEDLEERPTDTVEYFKDNLNKILPSMIEHTCSPGRRGGFFERLDRGTWAGHVCEHIALELQNLIGHEVSFGKTFTLDETGLYNIVFRYKVERVGLRAGEMAVDITNNLFNRKLTEIEPLLKELEVIAEECLLGPSTQSIVDEATKRGIPHIRLNEHSYVQLGQGKYQRRIQATIMDNTSTIGVEIARNKERTKEILASNGIPVPQGRSASSLEEALNVVEDIGFPVVVKPLDGNHGRGITTDVNNEKDLKAAIELANKVSENLVIEKYIKGNDFRLMVIDGKFQAAALREPAYVIGDGKSTIEELINQENLNPKRGDGHEKALTRIKIDSETTRVLDLHGLKISDCIPEGEKVYVKSTANISSGGTAIDVTGSVHPLNIIMAERISQLIGLNVMGIDIMAESLEVPLTSENSGVVEVNAAPGFRMHLYPSEGTPINIAKPVVDMLFPEGSRHSIPLCAVTGTNGKTTTTRIISHILGVNGYTVGMTSTDAVVIDNVPILKGDYSGPGGAEAVMKDSTVDCGVLEVARGGIARRGLGFSSCDVGVILNVSSDHLGFNGIETLEELARLKSTVVETVKKDGYAIFNGDDKLAMLRVDKVKANKVFFSKDKNNKILKDNLRNGNFNVTLDGDTIILQKPGGNTEVSKIIDIPITFEGRATFNVENVMAAVGAAHAMGMSEEQIRSGLISFSPSISQSPGRMNIIDIGDFKVLIDYGHNIGAIHATGEFVKSLMPGRKIRMASGVGNRRIEDIKEFGQALAKYYDHIVITDASPRIRKLGETAGYVKEGLIEGGLREDQITVELMEKDAVQVALNMGGPGDLIMLQVENIPKVTQAVLDFKKKYLEEMLKNKK